MKILVTGFTPFGNLITNSSLQVLAKLPETVKKIILPVTYPEAFDKVKPIIEQNDPDLIILMGMAASRHNITIENQAINELDFIIPDNNNNLLSHEKISNINEEFLYSSLNIKELVTDLKNQGFDCDLSVDAGKFICNYLYFKVLEEFKNKNIVFVHLPILKKEEEINKATEVINAIIKKYE